MSVGLICLKTGRLSTDTDANVDSEDHMWVPISEGEPYFAQIVGSDSEPADRTDDGRFDRSHLSPENAWRIGRDYLAHCIRYGFPMKVIKEHFGAGVRILEMGCGKELPLFRTLTCDHSATKYYKPSVYVGADLNEIKYHPKVSGIDTTILQRTNIVDNRERVPNVPFDVVTSFEVIEHMDKADGQRFLDGMFDFARRKPTQENKASIILLSTPVNNGRIAKNHIYEWHRGELRRALEDRGGVVVGEYGTFSNIIALERVLTPIEREVWNSLCSYHSPHVLSSIFSANHPEVARNIAWKVEVRP
jgi:hypothetical protein